MMTSSKLTGIFVGLLILAAVASLPAAAATTTTMTATNTTNNTTTAGYYENYSANVSSEQESWMDGHSDGAKLSNWLEYIMRAPGFVIGNDWRAQGGAGPAGTIIFGLIIFGTLVLTMARSGVGTAGGAVLTVTAGYGMTHVGLLPSWLYIAGLIVLGAAISGIAQRTL